MDTLFTNITTRYSFSRCDYTMSAPSYSSAPSRGAENYIEPCWFQRLVEPTFPSSRVVDAKPLKGHLHPIYLLRLSNGVELTLKMHTRASTSLMRHEALTFETEAKVLSRLCASKFRYAPRLIQFNRRPESGINDNYILREYIRGTALSEIEASPLADNDRQYIERQLGSAVRQIGEHTASSFGTVEAVSSGRGQSSWKRAFLVLVDSLLFEAENKLITLPHVEIRQQAVRLIGALDDVLKPRLVVLAIGKPSHIIVDPSTKRISGFTDFGNAFWADVLFSEVFENPSPAFLQGYGFDPTEDKSAHARLLL